VVVLKLIDLVRYAKTHEAELGLEEPFTWAIQEARKQEILPKCLERKASEVLNMFDMEYDYDVDVEVQKRRSKR